MTTTLYGRVELARREGVHPRTVDRWVRVGVRGVRLAPTLNGSRVGFTEADISAFKEAVEQAAREPRPEPPLPPAALNALAAAAALDRPASRKALARRAGCKFGSHFSEIVTTLVRRGLLAVDPDGYIVPAEGVPA